MCVSMFMSMFVYVYMCVCECLSCMCIYAHLYVYICLYVWLCLHVACVCMSVYVWVCICVCFLRHYLHMSVYIVLKSRNSCLLLHTAFWTYGSVSCWGSACWYIWHCQLPQITGFVFLSWALLRWCSKMGSKGTTAGFSCRYLLVGCFPSAWDRCGWIASTKAV